MREFHEVRKDIAGDPEASAPYMGAARTLLGQLKQRMAAGGIQHLSRSVTLADGTIISVLSRFGQDTIRIFTTTLQPSSSQPGTEWSPPPIPHPKPDSPTSDEQTQDQHAQSMPYMWVGARIRWEDYGFYVNQSLGFTSMPFLGLVMCVVEPGNNGVILADEPIYWIVDEQVDKTTRTVNVAANQATFASNWPNAPSGVHNFGMWIHENGRSPEFSYSKNGLRLYSTNTSDLDTDVLTPYDPMVKPGGGGRAVPPGLSYYGDYTKWASTHTWDQVAVLDPFEAQGVPPFDPRPDVQWTRNLMQRSGVKTGLDGVLSGNYEILIGAYADPQPGSDRGNAQSPYLPSNQGFRYDHDDFREHLTLVHKPLRVEIEVRLGKLPHTKIQRFTVEVPDYDDWGRTTFPYGGSDGSGCAYFTGGNPLAHNWWAGAILVNPWAATASYAPGHVSRIFQPAAYSLDSLRRKRYPVDIYYMTLGNSSPSKAGAMMYQIMDMQCCSYFGYGYELVQRSAADATAAATAAGIVFNRVYRYDNSSNTFTDVGYYNGLTDFRTMADPLGAASLAVCHLPIFCGSDSSISGNYWGSPPGQAGCCADTYFGN